MDDHTLFGASSRFFSLLKIIALAFSLGLLTIWDGSFLYPYTSNLPTVLVNWPTCVSKFLMVLGQPLPPKGGATPWLLNRMNRGWDVGIHSLKLSDAQDPPKRRVQSILVTGSKWTIKRVCCFSRRIKEKEEA